MKIFEFKGSHQEIGTQIGSLFRREINHSVYDTIRNPPKFFNRSDCESYLNKSIEITKHCIPHIFAEIEAISKASGVRLRDFFFSACEELWDYEELPSVPERCTDLVCGPRSTASGLTHVLHTNDASESITPKILKLSVNGKPSVMGISLDEYFLSFGCNSAGMVFTGNALTCNDIKPGIPRLLAFRSGCEKVDSFDAMAEFTSLFRSTSYHNIVIDASGRPTIVEASGDSQASILPINDIHVHTNHYDVLTSKDLNLAPESSIYRSSKALEVASDKYGRIDTDVLKNIASDHGLTGRDGICRHAPDRATCFSVICTPQTGEIIIGDGSPCLGNWTAMKYW